MWAIVNKDSGEICGYTGEADFKPPNGFAVATLPDDYDESKADLLVYRKNKLTYDRVRLLDSEREAIRSKVKEEARQRIEATSWRLERAKEREYLGVSGLPDIDAVLAEREAIRQYSNNVETQLDALTEVEAVRSLSWSFDNIEIAVPNRMTRKQFLDRFAPEEMAGIMAAADASPAIKAWLTVFQNAELVDLGDLSLQMGVGALEMAGLIVPGRAAEILNS